MIYAKANGHEQIKAALVELVLAYEHGSYTCSKQKTSEL